jgi:hypothetical protein
VGLPKHLDFLEAYKWPFLLNWLPSFVKSFEEYDFIDLGLK